MDNNTLTRHLGTWKLGSNDSTPNQYRQAVEQLGLVRSGCFPPLKLSKITKMLPKVWPTGEEQAGLFFPRADQRD